MKSSAKYAELLACTKIYVTTPYLSMHEVWLRLAFALVVTYLPSLASN